MPHVPPPRARGRLRLALGFCLFLAASGFFLWTEHRAHLFGILPYLILLACPFVHFFMHRGHGGHAHPPGRTDGSRRRADAGDGP